MEKDYTEYSAKQLIEDNYFIHSVLHPTKESEMYWNELEKRHASLGDEIRAARFIIIHFRQQCQRQILQDDEKKDLWNRIQLQNKNAKQRKIRNMYYWGSIAAAIIIFIVFILPSQEHSVDYESIIASSPEQVDSKNVTLILSTKEQFIIQGNESKILYNKSGKINIQSQYVKNNKQKEKKSVKHDNYNKLIVPAGKRSFLKLSDGSKIWVNASSLVVYPNTFELDKREIYVMGEAYLEVVHESKRPFYVKTADASVRVLGTSFNICSYPDDIKQQIVLLSGKVEVKNKNNGKTILQPNEMYEYIKQTERENVIKVNAKEFISWKDGIYQFSNQSLYAVFNRISKYYDKKIVCNKEIARLKCSGKLDFSKNIEDVLKNLQFAAPIIIEHDHGIIIIRKSNTKIKSL